MHHLLTWLLDFTGVNYGQNNFATHMYNFWSGFGADITEFALIGALVTLYRKHAQNSRLLNNRLLEVLHKRKDEASSDTTKK